MRARPAPNLDVPEPLRYDPAQTWGDRRIFLRFNEPGYLRWHLSPCGWLHSLVFTMEEPDAHWSIRVSAELTAPDDAPLFGECARPELPWSIEAWAMVLDEPVPNLNGSSPYVVKVTASNACVVSVRQLFHPQSPYAGT